MANVTQSLFGFTPQDIQAQRQAELDKRAASFAQLTPMQQAQAGFYRAGSMFGDVAAGALGYEDPEIAQARARQGLLGGLDMNDPESLLQAAKSIQATDPEAALYLRGKGTELQTARNIAAEKQQQLVSLARVVQQKTGLSPEESLALAADPATVRELMKVETQVVEANGRQVLINKNTGQPIRDLGAAPDKRSVTNVNLGGPDTTVKAFEVADADNLKNLRTAASAAAGQLGFIAQARDQVNNTAVAGTGVPTVVRGLNAVLAPLGINADQVAKTRNLEQALNSIIAQGIKQYGANPSTADLEFAKRASASITDPKQAIAETLNYLEERANALISKSTAADDYLLRNKNLGGFEQFWVNQQRNKDNPPSQSGVRKTKSGVSYTVSPQN